MQPFFSGPHGAEQEEGPHADFWADVPEGGDMLPGSLPPEDDADTEGSEPGFSVNLQEPYGPALGHRMHSESQAESALPHETQEDAPDSESTESTEDTEDTEEFEDTEELEEPQNSQENSDAVEEIADPENQASHNDPLGSWTGVPDLNTPDLEEIPTQDQDDL
ncbi:MAG: hypothetical protein PHO10_06585 [Gemmiger sp.]|nr:hypothetical protein [Gemmiger sp.]